jgi:hypothetical protein
MLMPIPKSETGGTIAGPLPDSLPCPPLAWLSAAGGPGAILPPGRCRAMGGDADEEDNEDEDEDEEQEDEDEDDRDDDEDEDDEDDEDDEEED